MKMPLCRSCHDILTTPFSHHVRNWSAPKRAPCNAVPDQLPSVTQIWTLGALRPQDWLMRPWRADTMPGISFCGALMGSLLGYQWTMTKSMFWPQAVSTFWFQFGVTPSGQLPGVVKTAPTFIVGSLAFIAATKAFTLAP